MVERRMKLFNTLATVVISMGSGALLMKQEYLLAIAALGAIYVIYMMEVEEE